MPLALPVPRVISTGGASGTRKTCCEDKLLPVCYAEERATSNLISPRPLSLCVSKRYSALQVRAGRLVAAGGRAKPLMILAVGS